MRIREEDIADVVMWIALTSVLIWIWVVGLTLLIVTETKNAVLYILKKEKWKH
jgi:hypothetical protein